MKANMKDKEGNQVFFGDVFWANLISPSPYPPTKVMVVEDLSPENVECDRNFDVEDEQGNRIWNAYMVIAHGVRNVKPQFDGGEQWHINEKAKLITNHDTTQHNHRGGEEGGKREV